MSDFLLSKGFEEVWRPPVRPRRVRPETVLDPSRSSGHAKARLARIVRRAPEVMVKITGRTRGGEHLAAHLQYITRRGELEAEDRDGCLICGRREVAELAADWQTMAEMDSRRGPRTPTGLSLVLSMPAQTDPLRLRDAARVFARETFGGVHDYVFVLHTDAGRADIH